MFTRPAQADAGGKVERRSSVFEGDTYFVLVHGGEAALAALSGFLVFLAVAAVRLARRHVELRAAASGVGFFLWWLFVWLTPQAYYLLYMALVDGLGFALIIGWPPWPARLFELLTFQGRASSIDPGLGALGWAMILLSLPKA